MDSGDVRAVSFSVVAVTTALVFLLIVVGRRHFALEKESAKDAR